MNKKWRRANFDPYRIETPKPIDMKFCIRDYVREMTQFQIWCKSSTGGSEQIGKYNTFEFIYLYFSLT